MLLFDTFEMSLDVTGCMQKSSIAWMELFQSNVNCVVVCNTFDTYEMSISQILIFRQTWMEVFKVVKIIVFVYTLECQFHNLFKNKLLSKPLSMELWKQNTFIRDNSTTSSCNYVKENFR